MSHFQRWLDRFFESYFRRHPVDATFIGHHHHDHRLPDFRENDAASLLSELNELPDEPLTPFEEIDRTLARGQLEVERWEHESGRFRERNPSAYTGEAIFGVFSLLLRDFAPREKRYESAAERLAAISPFLETGQSLVRESPRAWIDRARRECEGAVDFLDFGLRRLESADRLLAPAAEARRAFASFHDHLEQKVREAPDGSYACGEDAFHRLLRYAHYLDEPASEIAAAARAALKAEAPEEPGTDRLHRGDEVLRRARELWDDCRAFAVEQQLVTWPYYPVDFKPQPPWAREAAGKLYFLFYRSPAPFDGLSRVDHLLPPAESGLSESVLKLNHVIHHAALGHHLQNWYAFRAPSRIGRIAAVDGPYRIAMLCGGTMAEGWASYATELMNDLGFLTPFESHDEERARARAAARAVADVELHTGRLSFEAAVTFYREQAGMSEPAARSEVTKNSLFPGAALIYFVGSGLIRELRRDHEKRLGLRGFHDRLLSYGSIPVALIARAMRSEG